MAHEPIHYGMGDTLWVLQKYAHTLRLFAQCDLLSLPCPSALSNIAYSLASKEYVRSATVYLNMNFLVFWGVLGLDRA